METWKVHPNWTDYEVSDVGRVRRATRGKGARYGRILSQFPGTTGYLCVTLNGCRLRKVHLLVLETFIGPKPEGKEARHLDDNKNNNVLTNLRWGTHAENYADRIKNGGGNHGIRNGNAYLTESIATSIRSAHAAGKTMRIIEAETGVSLATVCRIINGQSYV